MFPVSGKDIDEYATVVRLITEVAGASEHVDAGLARMSDLLVDLLSSLQRLPGAESRSVDHPWDDH